MSEPDAFKISEAVIDLWRCYTIERDMAKELEAENARLKAQIDAKMKVGVPYADYERLFAENARLKAEVERLTKAGDYLATNIPRMVACRVEADEATHLMEVWNAAKEGKPSV
jgi:cell division protein FtsB